MYYSAERGKNPLLARSLRWGGDRKNLFTSDRAGILIQEFIHAETAKRNGRSAKPSSSTRRKKEDGEKQVDASDDTSTASLLTDISSYFFGYLAEFRIPSHYLERISDREILVRELSMIPLTVEVYTHSSSGFARRLGISEGTELPFPVVEHYYKNVTSGDQLLNEFHMYSLKLITPDQLRSINRIASKATAVLRSLFERRGLRLVSLSLEFGLLEEQVCVGDELTPRTIKFYDERDTDKRKKAPLGSNGTLRDSCLLLQSRLRLPRKDL
jgi:phosphoribosylaminoimidazole-succinocarboxamide synthase